MKILIARCVSILILLIPLIGGCSKPSPVMMSVPETNMRWFAGHFDEGLTSGQSNALAGIFSNDHRELALLHDVYKDNYDRSFDRYMVAGVRGLTAKTTADIDAVLAGPQHRAFRDIREMMNGMHPRTAVMYVQLLLTYEQLAAIEMHRPPRGMRPDAGNGRRPSGNERVESRYGTGDMIRKADEMLIKVLTPEQRKEYQHFLKERGEDKARPLTMPSKRVSTSAADMPPPPPGGP